MKTTHTPGPWTAFSDTCVAHEGELIAEVLRGGDRQLPIQSNRRLIMAAPTLLDALRKTADLVDKMFRHFSDYTEEDAQTIAQARAAIAKATEASQ